MSEDFTPMTALDVSALVAELVATPNEAIDFIKVLIINRAALKRRDNA